MSSLFAQMAEAHASLLTAAAAAAAEEDAGAARLLELSTAARDLDPVSYTHLTLPTKA